MTPPSPIPAVPLEPAFVNVEVVSGMAPTAQSEFTYLHQADVAFERDDVDNDRVRDVIDNCPTVANRGQKDSNLNNIGDACEGAPSVPALSNVVIVILAISLAVLGTILLWLRRPTSTWS